MLQIPHNLANGMTATEKDTTVSHSADQNIRLNSEQVHEGRLWLVSQ